MIELVLVVVGLLVLIAVTGFVAAMKKRDGRPSSDDLQYQSSKVLFSAAERSFLGVLDQAVGPEYRVFGKVRVADVASLKSGLSNSARQVALKRVAAKHFDFVVCRASDLSLVCAVELNDKSHSSRRVQARDEFLAKVCSVIRLPLLSVEAKRAYSVHEIHQHFASLTSSARGPVPHVGQSN
ncbi:DUF2726 domain-containing protein [Steroidobacter cummioxidans]|uniref:DUF2726 domain-containing protein n=1 Tax=Steroidobacter cummioxidans TaxID=1803913 RepID=UPI000E318118|nr:DUF2726 domain-containing protein [Steroidobacter cummioxidans]